MLFIVIIFGIIIGNVLWWIWADRAARRLRSAKIWRRAIGAFVIVQLGYILFFILAPIVARQIHLWTPMPIVIAIYLWNLLIMPATLVVLGCSWLGARLYTLARYSGRGQGEGSSMIANRPTSPQSPHVNPLPDYRERKPELSRRQLLTAAAITVPPLVSVALTGRAMQQLGTLRVRSIDVPIPNLPYAFDGLTIAQVSDTHIGRFTRPQILPQIVEMTNKLRADIVVFTGDLIDMSLAELDRGIEFLHKLDPRHGMMIIEGNHDLFIDAEEFEQRTRSANLPVLFDESRTLLVRGLPIQFLGIRWGRQGDVPRRHSSNEIIRESVSRILKLRDPSAFPILLAHHPHAFDAAAEASIPLTLSGHTHGGQLMLSERLGAGPVMFKYWSGLYRKANSSLVVSNGTGNWFPLRVNAPAEILHLTLRRPM